MTALIPTGAREKHIAFLGATGSGKTSAAKRGLVEPVLADGGRALILDPTGAWWGLRLMADGKKAGYAIYIFGGDHGDYPLRARDAALLAETFAASSDSAIFDMSLMTVSERTSFFTEFAETIRRKNKGPLHLIIDEAHLFMPQAGAASGGAVPAMLHAANNLVSLGRSRGLRIALISQRPAKVHKDSLTQVQSLVAMRLLAPQDRKAISDWIADQADPARGKEIIASLPSLKPGEAWVWSPQDDVLRHTKFPLLLCFPRVLLAV
jgi:DNA helicase HerA-like ATPase